MRAHSFQLYPDCDAIRAHWSMSDPFIADVMRHCVVESLVIYGQPDDEVMRRLPDLVPPDVAWRVVPRRIGFVTAAPKYRITDISDPLSVHDGY